MQVYHGTVNTPSSVAFTIDELVGLRLPHGRVVVHQDADWNVIALTDLKGAVLERYSYSPYGELEVVANSYFGDCNGDGFVNATDAASLCSSGCTCSYGTATGACRVFDFDADGDLDATDQQTLASLYTGRSADLQNRRIPSTSASPLGNPFAHQGLALDPEIHSYQNRARQYSAKIRRYIQRDAYGMVPWFDADSYYASGVNLYEYVGASPLSNTDPTGFVLQGIACSPVWITMTGSACCNCYAPTGCGFCWLWPCYQRACNDVPLICWPVGPGSTTRRWRINAGTAGCGAPGVGCGAGCTGC